MALQQPHETELLLYSVDKADECLKSVLTSPGNADLMA